MDRQSQEELNPRRGAFAPGEGGSLGISPAWSPEAELKKQSFREKKEEMKGRAKEETRSIFSGQKDRAAEGLDKVAQALRQAGENLRAQNLDWADPYAARAAGRIEQASQYLKERSVPQMMEELEHFARRRPGVFLSGALALGFLLGRLLKSSRTRSGDGQVLEETT